MHNNWTRSTVVEELLPSIVNLTVANVRLRSPLRVVSKTVFATVKSTIDGGNYKKMYSTTVLLFLNRSFLSSVSLVYSFDNVDAALLEIYAISSFFTRFLNS